MLDGSAGCIGRWNHFGEDGIDAIAHFHATHRFWESCSKTGSSNGTWIGLPADFSRMPGTWSTCFPVRTPLIRLYE
jgi:hypothetical protein